MDKPFLIAHVVRGEPAFDIAIKMDCPICGGRGWTAREIVGQERCDECDSLGYWWICSTSGHRARAYWDCRLEDCLVNGMGEYESITYGVPDPPPSWPDPYTVNKAPSGLSLIEQLKLHPTPLTIKRRV